MEAYLAKMFELIQMIKGDIVEHFIVAHEVGYYSFYPYLSGLIVLLWIIILFILLFKFWKKSSFYVFFELFFEKIYDFFEDILWKEEKPWIKKYITVLFFVILLSNLTWVILGFASKFFDWAFLWKFLYKWITIPTADINFNIAMATIALVIILIEQFRALWFGKALYEYFPILGKNYIPYERGNLPSFIDWPIFILIKFFDIVISVFLWLLEIVGHAAKIISLSFRLFWNVTSGWILLWMLFGALIWATAFIGGLTWAEGDGFPIIAPVLLYLQELLVAFIQALVFPLLVAIFIKVAKVH